MELRGSLKNFPLPDIIQLIGMGRRTGVLTVILDTEESASIYFHEGEMIHAQFGEAEGAPVIYRLFRKQEGKFQFSAGAPAPRRTIKADWMSIVMEAARRFDEEENHGGEPSAEPEPEVVDTPSVDPEAIRRAMVAILEKHFGKKARKIEEELEKVEADPDRLLEFCNKAEKYIYVFIDNRKAKEVAEELRAVARVDRFA